MTILACLRRTVGFVSSSPRRRAHGVVALALACAFGFGGAPAFGQDDDPATQLEDFVHYTKIAKVDLAAAWGQRLLESGVTNAELATLVEADPQLLRRFDEAILRALLVPELEDIAAELGRRVEMGRLDLARDGDRVEQAVAMLTGTARQRLLAKGRLKRAGEYAVPALLKTITDGNDAQLQQASRNMLLEIGLPAVAPLSAALSEIDPDSQVVVCDLLGDIGYPHAAPYLRDLGAAPGTAGPAAAAATRALGAIRASTDDLDVLYGRLAQQYYDGHGSLTPYPHEATNNVWAYDAFVGLVATPVPTEIFSEVMAMRLAARALELNPGNRAALGLYVASNLKRENDLPLGAADPIFGERKYSPEFYATVFGTGICQDVLARAVDTNDTPLVRDAIAALVKTTGGGNLFGAESARQPLLEALYYPDRRVQYEAALTLGRALPERSFDGDYRVVPLLASAVRTGNQSFALVVADVEENRRGEVTALEGLNFTIAGAEDSVDAVRGAIDESIGVDLVVVRLDSADAAVEAVTRLRATNKVAAAPILIIASAVDVPSLKLHFRDKSNVAVTRPVSGEPYELVVNALLARASGGRMTDAEAEAYAFEALAVLEDVAISCSPAYEIADAELALIDALATRTGRARLLVAGILARIDSDRAQRVLFDAALDASGGERIDMLQNVAASVKRFGDRAEVRHTAALLDLVANSTGSTADAAAELYGALNMSTAEAVGLIHEQ
jgi:DNA-binding response OmpR family regulator